VSGVTTSLLDTFTSGVLSIGSSVASSISLGSASTPTNVKGVLSVGAGANTIKLNANNGLNQLLITDSAGTSGQVLTSGGAAGSLSWAAGGGVSLSGNNTWSGTNNFINSTSLSTIDTDILLSSGKGIKVGTVPASTVGGGTLYNKPIFSSATLGGSVTFTADYIGDTQYAYMSSNSAVFSSGETTVFTMNVVKTGVYAFSWMAEYKNTGTVSRIRQINTYVRTGNATSPPTVNGGYSIPYQVQYASNRPYYATGINFNSYAGGFNGSSTAFLQGSETGIGGSGIVQLQVYVDYSTLPADMYLVGGILSNVFIITRIA
jgi:hypothetical protein